VRGADLRTGLARLFLVIAGGLALFWVSMALPTFRADAGIVEIAKAVVAGETFRPGLLDAIVSKAEGGEGSSFRSSVQGKAAVILLRLAEDTLRSNDKERSDKRLDSLTQIIDTALANAPSDPFLWLARFWVDDSRHGFTVRHVPDLRMSYNLGRYEGWIAIKRNPLALAILPKLPSDVSELTILEFVGLVRSGLVSEAADIAAGTSPGLRGLLFARLKELSLDQRRAFAHRFYVKELDDVPVPGISPPLPQIRMPVLPPDF